MLLLSVTCSAAARPHHHTSTHALMRHTESTRTHRASEHPSYASISSERATEIQSALIKRGYLSGEPTGTWDSASVSAMQKLQGDNGWQTRLVPDSRALIKLGLGPNSNPATALGPVAVSGSAAAPAISATTAVASDTIPASN
jgi:hypothetical protein